MIRESPANTNMNYLPNNFYNRTGTYRRGSDLFMPQFKVSKGAMQSQSENLHKLPQLTYIRQTGEPMILWIVSHCKTRGKREQYVDKLQTYIKVNISGSCSKSQKRCPIACHNLYAKTGKFKFYLAFENTVCKDYFSLKPFRALRAKMVPIVYGGLTAQDHQDLLPPNSYIDVRDFSSPKHLADYLLYLDTNTTAYMEYFKWRMEYKISHMNKNSRICQICNELPHMLMAKPSTVDIKQFWNATTQCDADLLYKVIG